MTAKKLRASSFEEKIGKTDPNFSFHGDKSVTQGFLMPTSDVQVYQETAEQV